MLFLVSIYHSDCFQNFSLYEEKISKIFNKKILIKRSNEKMKDKRNKQPNFWCEKDYTAQLMELKDFMKGNMKYETYLHYSNE